VVQLADFANVLVPVVMVDHSRKVGFPGVGLEETPLEHRDEFRSVVGPDRVHGDETLHGRVFSHEAFNGRPSEDSVGHTGPHRVRTVGVLEHPSHVDDASASRDLVVEHDHNGSREGLQVPVHGYELGLAGTDVTALDPVDHRDLDAEVLADPEDG